MGHTMPIIAIARELKTAQSNIAVHYIGPKDDCALISKEDFKTHAVAGGKIRRYFSLSNITDIVFKIPFSFLQSFFLLLFIRPKLVFSKGGTGSLPATYCARILRIPVFIHESDTVPGKSNKISSKWAKKIFTSFEKTAYFNPSKTILVGNPIKGGLLDGNEQSAKEIFHLNSQKPVILILGGSQGSQPVNNFILSILELLLERYELIHICGKKNYSQVLKQSKAILGPDASRLEGYYHILEFLDETSLKHALKIASFIVSRAGSGSIFEIAASGKPGILIPLPSSANDHQSKNAYAYAKTGSAMVLEQESINPNYFLEKVDYFISNAKAWEDMKNNALKFAKPEAAKIIAKEIMDYLIYEKK